MTVPVPGSLTCSYDEDGITTVFPYPVRFLEPQELTVIREVAGAQTVLAYNVDYTVSGAGNPDGGSITRTAVTDGGKIIISRSTAWKQIVDLEDKARNPAEAVELQMDRLTMAGQDVARRVGVVEVQATEIDDAVRRSEEAAEAAESAEQAASSAAEAAEQAAGSVQFPVSYGISQSLSTSQRLQAQANIGVAELDTVARFGDYEASADQNFIRTAGYSASGDGGGALYKRVLTEPSHAGKFQSADGAWWELAELVVAPEMFGAVGDGVANDHAALTNALEYSRLKKATVQCTNIYRIESTLVFESTESISFAAGSFIDVADSVTDGVLVGGASQFKGSLQGLCVTRSARTVPQIGTGVKIVNATIGTKIEYLDVSYFDVGLDFAPGDNQHVGYVSFIAPMLWRNKINQRLNPSGTGWANENVHFGGTWSAGSPITGAVATHNLLMVAGNHNKWYGGSFEGRNSGMTNGVANLEIHGNRNIFVDLRTEGPGYPLIYKLGAGSYDNFITTQRIDGGIEDLGNDNKIVRQNFHSPGTGVPYVIWRQNAGLPPFNSATILSAVNGAGDVRATVVSKNDASAVLGLGDIDSEAVGGLLYNNADDTLYLRRGGNSELRLSSAGFRPQNDNTHALGFTSGRWTTVYAASGTINTSDETLKQDIGPIPDEWLDAWGDVEWSRYKWIDAVSEKDGGARWHIGLIAQRVEAAFRDRGIDAFEIGLLCYDEWVGEPAVVDDEGNILSPAITKGSRYGIRYSEAFALEAAYVRRELQRLRAD